MEADLTRLVNKGVACDVARMKPMFGFMEGRRLRMASAIDNIRPFRRRRHRAEHTIVGA